MAKKTAQDDKTFWSVLIVLVGVGWLAVNLGLIDPAMTRYWPIILVIVGLLGLTGGINRK